MVAQTMNNHKISYTNYPPLHLLNAISPTLITMVAQTMNNHKTALTRLQSNKAFHMYRTMLLKLMVCTYGI